MIKSRRHARKTEQVSRPLFPRYMFVLIDSTHQGWHAIRSTFGVSSLIGGDTEPGPAALDPPTVNVYAVPFVSPVTAHDSAPVVEHVAPPGDAVTT